MDAKDKTLAITGATGFVGEHVLNMAVRDGFQVRALTRKRQDDRPHVAWVRGSLSDPASLRQLCEGSDAIIHIAGVVNAPTRELFEAGNVAGTMGLVEAAKQSGVRRLIHVSSLAATLPKLSIYGDTKAKAEKIVSASGLDWTIIRPPWVYGPGDRDTLDMFKTVKYGFVPLPPNKNAKISVIHVEDLARALLVIIAENDDLTAQLFEIDDGKLGGWTHHSFAKAIGWAFDKDIRTIAVAKNLLEFGVKADRLLRRGKAKLTQDRVNYFCHDDWTVNPIKRLPPEIWKPQIESRQGLKDTARWYRSNDWL